MFDAATARANWPTATGIRIGPEQDLLVAGGKVRAELHLPGRLLWVTGEVTEFEPGARIAAAGTHSGISATMVVQFADNADHPDRHQPVTTTLTWLFEAHLPHWLAILELPAAAAITAAIPVLRASILRQHRCRS